MRDRYEGQTKKACASCIHKSRIKRDSSVTWCLKLMIHIDQPQFACLFYQEAGTKAPLSARALPAEKN
jgi:hypothetical protein